MNTSIEIALKCGYIQDKKIIITPEEANRLKPSQVCLLCTGSQGEPLAALSRIANGSHKQIKLMPNDIVIFSSSSKVLPLYSIDCHCLINSSSEKTAGVINSFR